MSILVSSRGVVAGGADPTGPGRSRRPGGGGDPELARAVPRVAAGARQSPGRTGSGSGVSVPAKASFTEKSGFIIERGFHVEITIELVAGDIRRRTRPGRLDGRSILSA